MRLVVCVLSCAAAASVMTPAFADPEGKAPSASLQGNAPTATPAKPASTTPAAQAPAAAATATPATAAAAALPATSPATATADHAAVEIDAPQMEQLEKHFLSEGYKIEIYNGEKYFCRRQEELGSRLGGQKRCAPAQQLMFTEKDARRQLEHAQRNQTSSP